MPCYSPMTAGFTRSGDLTFSSKQFCKEIQAFQLPCGKCIGCRLDRSREWAVRCYHETQMHEKNCFITLTYTDQYLPKTEDGLPTLKHEHFQDFMKSLRHLFGEGIGFFMCGEYGEKFHRPHYHAILFGVDFDDKEFLKHNEHGDPIYKSKTLEKLWKFNDPELVPNEIGAATFKSAAYIARYVTKKLGGPMESLYDGRTPDYGKTSRKYAIGKKWLEKYWTDVFNHNEVILPEGGRAPIPRYYKKWLEKNHFQRYLDFKGRDLSHFDTWKYKLENTPQRLRIKKLYKEAQIKTLTRKMDSGS